jgi:broad specificity phosphatase PhoE
MPLVALLRHGEEDGADPARRIETRSRRGLSSRGRAQARAARDFLAPLDADRIVCSDSVRAIETAAIVADGRPLEIVPELAGLALGEWEGRGIGELPELARVLTGREARPPQGESLGDLHARAWPAFAHALPESGDAIVVAHRLVNAVLLAGPLGLSLDAAGLIQQGAGAVSVLERAGSELTVSMLNVTPLDPLRCGLSAVTLL